jgi:hypothetical protein
MREKQFILLLPDYKNGAENQAQRQSILDA